MNSKILFIINGLGLGNSTRCAAVIEELNQLNYEVDVLTSGNGLHYFSTGSMAKQIYKLKALKYASSDGKLNAFKTFLLIPKFLLLFFENRRVLKQVLRNNSYSAIVFDSDYTTFGLKRKTGPLMVAINNAAYIIEEFRHIKRFPSNIMLQFLIEKIDCWFHRIAPDLVLCPTFSRIEIKQKNLICVPPFIRSGLDQKTPKNGVKDILVMLSGSQFGSNTSFLNNFSGTAETKIHVVGKEGDSTDKIIFHGKVLNNKELINNADMLVINAGFSAISEAVLLKIPAVVIPIENHAEQFINAQLFESNGFGILATQENAGTKMQELISNFDKFQTAFKNFEISNNGTKLAARLIDKAIKSKELNV